MSVTLYVNDSDQNLDTADLALDRLVSDSAGPSVLTFIERGKPYQNTYNQTDMVRLEETANGVLFRGRVVDVQHDAGSVRYLCHNHRGLARNVQVTGVDSDFPRRIYNAPPGDEDAERNAIANHRSTVGQIIDDLFDAFSTELTAEDAAGTTPTWNTSGLTFVPPKMVFEATTFEGAIAQLVSEQGPTWAVYVDPGGTWRFYNRHATPGTKDITLDGGEVLASGFRLRRHARDRYTAVKVFASRGAGEEIIPWQVGFGTDETGSTLEGLEPAWNSALESQWSRRDASGEKDRGIISGTTSNTFDITGRTWDADVFANGTAIFPRYSMSTRFTITGNDADTITLSTSLPAGVQVGDPVILEGYGTAGALGDVFRLFQITDTDKRDIIAESTGAVDCCPHIEVVLRNSNDDVVGKQIVDVKLEGGGQIRTALPLFTDLGGHNGREQGTSVAYTDGVKFTYCYRDNSTESELTSRFPSSGFSGEAAGTPWGIQRELRVIVSDYEDQVDDAGLYGQLAQELHRLTSQVQTTGSITLTQLHYQDLDTRNRLALHHSSDTTGWESANIPVSTVELEFQRSVTAFGVGDDGSTSSTDYQPILAQLRSSRASSLAGRESGKSSDWINCRNFQTGAARDRFAQPFQDEVEFTSAGDTPPSPTYKFPQENRDSRLEEGSTTCNCDALTDPCNTQFQTASAQHKFLCMPDLQHGLMVRHPGLPNTGFCKTSQLLRVSGSDWPDSQRYRGSYFPFACKTLPIGFDPVDPQPPDLTGTQTPPFCGSLGYREIVVVEPEDMDNGVTGSQISTAQYLIEFVKSYDGFMQHNEEAHCCLDNRLACVDDALYGGVNCKNSGDDNPSCIDDRVNGACGTFECAILALKAQVELIMKCLTNHEINCNIDSWTWNTDGCGPC